MPSVASMLMRDCAAALHGFHHTAGSNTLSAKSSRRPPRHPNVASTQRSRDALDTAESAT